MRMPDGWLGSFIAIPRGILPKIKAWVVKQLQKIKMGNHDDQFLGKDVLDPAVIRME